MSDAIPSAATVVLLRDGVDGLETFLLRRVASMAFAPRMHVFPGGRVDDSDYRVSISLPGADVEELARRASTDTPELLALYSCAVRETREEAGIDLVETTCDGSLLIDPQALPIIDHWVTPEGQPRRYDVRFFAAMVTGDDARLTTTEADEARWLRPVDAVSEFEAGSLAVLAPTEHVLRWLSGFDTASDAVLAGGARTVRPLLPRRVSDEATDPRWIVVHERTGEVLVDPAVAPHTRESDGQPWTST